jgi:mono/diheme cytochrome c family protein
VRSPVSVVVTGGNRDLALGPDLDPLKPTVAVVRRQVTNDGGGMPAFGGRLSKAQIAAVADYVAGVAGTK